MNLSRSLLLLPVSLLSISWFSGKTTRHSSPAMVIPVTGATPTPPGGSKKIHDIGKDAKKFVKKNGFNTQVCFLVDMSLPSGENRFFIYDMSEEKVVNAAPVAHGSCYEYFLEGRRYSNTVGSGCTSLGKYKIGSPYYGTFGYSYKLYGLDSTNSHAFERTVVLHSYRSVPDTAVNREIWQSAGCPTVGTKFLQQLKGIINRSSRPILMWIYD